MRKTTEIFRYPELIKRLENETDKDSFDVSIAEGLCALKGAEKTAEMLTSDQKEIVIDAVELSLDYSEFVPESLIVLYKHLIKERKLGNIADEILKNTEGELLKDVIRYDKDIPCVIKTIAEDGYNISGFALIEVPDEKIFEFYNPKTNQAFTVACLVDENNADGKWVFAYLGNWNGDWPNASNVHIANTIKEAIEKNLYGKE